MDVGDAFALSFGQLVLAEPTPQEMDSWWLDDHLTRACSELVKYIEDSASVPDALLGGSMAARDAFLVCWAADRALKCVNPWWTNGSLESRVAEVARERYESTGRLDTGKDPEFIVLPKWREPQRPRSRPEATDDWFHYVLCVRPDALPRVAYSRVLSEYTPDADDREELRRGLPTVGCVPLLDDLGQVAVRRVDHGAGGYYALTPVEDAVTSMTLASVCDWLAARRVLLGVLPETTLTPQRLQQWSGHVQTAMARGGRPCYVLVGTGPFTVDDSTDAPPANRAVLLDCNGTEVLTQDKQRGYTVPADRAMQWGFEEFVDALDVALARHRQARAQETHSEEYHARLREAFAALAERHEFEPGQLVTWKPGLRNKMRPAAGAPVIVVEVLQEPVFDSIKGSASNYFREPLDLVAAWLDEDGDLQFFHFDSRRMQPYERPDNA